MYFRFYIKCVSVCTYGKEPQQLFAAVDVVEEAAAVAVVELVAVVVDDIGVEM